MMRQSLRPLVLLALVLAIAVVWPILRPPRSVAVPHFDAVVETAGTASVRLPFIARCNTNALSCDAAATPTVGSTPTVDTNTPGVTHVQIGRGFSDTGTHQILRTSGDRVYIFAPELFQKYVRALRATGSGTPNAFSEVDPAHRPVTASEVWAVDAAIDADDVVHILYITQAGPIVYQTFDTRSNLWGAATVITNSAWPSVGTNFRQGAEGVSLVVDADGMIHAVYGKTQSNLRRVYYNNNQGGQWNHELLVDDQPNNDNSHATLAFGSNGVLYIAWLSDNKTNKRAAIRVRALHDGMLASASLVQDNVFRNDDYSIDQGPSLLVTADGKVHVSYIDTWEMVPGAPAPGYAYGHARHKYSNDGGTTWHSDDPPLRYTHNPTLATDSQGNLYMFGHREEWKANQCASMFVSVQPAGAGWNEWKVLANGCYDSSVSVKWSQYHWRAPDVLDIVYWSQKGLNGEDNVNVLYYAEIRGGPSTVATLPSGGQP